MVNSRELHSWIQTAADTLVILLLSVVSAVAYQALGIARVGDIENAVTAGLAVAVLFALIGRLGAARRAAFVTGGFDRVKDTTVIWSLAFSALIFLFFMFKVGEAYSRGAVLTFFVVGGGLFSLWRGWSPPYMARLNHKFHRNGGECIVVYDIGDHDGDAFVEDLALDGVTKVKVQRFNAFCDGVAWPTESKKLVAGVIAEAQRMGPGDIFLRMHKAPSERVEAIAKALSILPRSIYIIPNEQVSGLVRCRAAKIGSQMAIEVRGAPLSRTEQAMKRLMDIVVSAMALIVLSPFFAVIGMAIKLDSRGTVFFKQTRNGLGGRPFKMFKFRSMRVMEDGPTIRQASRGDPRITRVGAFLRKTSIDELPQLINILIGDMSLVGPRPHAVAHDELYAKVIENYAVRQHVKPGLTGWAQVNGLRGETATLDLMYRRIEFDLWYAAHASLLLDVEIIVRTAFEVVRQRNAY